jgi:hypothetical protein
LRHLSILLPLLILKTHEGSAHRSPVSSGLFLFPHRPVSLQAHIDKSVKPPGAMIIPAVGIMELK